KGVGSPDLILLDLKLPGRMDGFTFLKWFRSEGKNVTKPVMVLTASNVPDDMRQAQRLGVQSYLTKPVNWTRFGEEVEGLLGGAGSSGFDQDAAIRLMQK